MVKRPLVLRGFIRGRDSHYEGVCLNLNLAVRGATLEETENKLIELISAYLQDAHESGNWNQLVPRRAPLSYYSEYYKLRFLSHCKSLTDFKLFIRSAPHSMAHA